MHSSPVIEGYKILAKIGEGATSIVWKAHQISLDRPVVVKVLSDKLSKEPEDVKLFLAEAQTAARLKHSGIIQVYDFGQIKDDGRYFFVMEYIAGYTVGEWVRRRGRIKESDAIIIAHHVSEALQYAWDQAHVIHCDIKPDNLMIDADGTVKVMDLGLAHIVFSKGISATGLDDGIVMGTPNYMSPEQAAGSGDLDCRTDVYALGMTLYHILTGVLPYGVGDDFAIIDKQIKEPLESPQAINPDLSAEITSIVTKMTAKSKTDRYQNWSEVLIAISALLHQQRSQSSFGAARQHSGQEQRTAKHMPPADAMSPDGEFKECPYCAEPVRKKAVFCRFCGKDIGKLPGKLATQEKASIKLRLKPVAMPVPAQLKAATAPKIRVSRKRRANWGGNIRMALSLILIGFLIYYWYNKMICERDILVPWKMKFERRVVTPLKAAGDQIEQKIKNLSGDRLPESKDSPGE